MKELIITLLSKETQISKDELSSLIEIPSNNKLGDYAFPCFNLAKVMKKNPLEIAKELGEKLRKNLPKEISNVSPSGSYINFFIDKGILAKNVLEESIKKDFGKFKGKSTKFVIEFSEPNTHKAFHVGHIRGTSVGESIARIHEFFGDKVFRINYSGDTGMHIAKWIWCFQKYHSNEKITNDESWIAGIYVDAVKRLTENESLQTEVDEINRKIESKEDKKINTLWETTRKASINSWKEIYKELNTHFDKHYFESEMESDGKKISKELLAKGIAKKDDAVFMDLKEYNLGVWVLLRRDDTVLYSAKDLALAIRKSEDFPADKYLVLVGDEQRMHFEQLKKTLELMKFPKAKDYNFQTFGMVRFPEGKMSSRTGKNILYSEFFEEVKTIALKGLKDRGTLAKNIEDRAEKIAIAAIKYSMLKQDSRKSIIFDPSEAISFEGDTGPYLLYSYARASSISRKVKSKKSIKILDLKEQEINLLKKINLFPETVHKAYTDLAPNIIANYSFELCKLFNEFYHECPVRGSLEEGFRLKLVESFRLTLKKSLELLGIDVLEEM